MRLTRRRCRAPSGTIVRPSRLNDSINHPSVSEAPSGVAMPIPASWMVSRSSETTALGADLAAITPLNVKVSEWLPPAGMVMTGLKVKVVIELMSGAFTVADPAGVESRNAFIVSELKISG